MVSSEQQVMGERLRFLYQARGSLREVEYYIHLAHRLGYLDGAARQDLETISNEACSTLHGLITYWKRQGITLTSQYSLPGNPL